MKILHSAFNFLFNNSFNRYNEPQRLEMKNATKEEITNPRNRNNKQNVLMTFLTGMKSGTKVFQHFLTRSNISQHMSGNLAHKIESYPK